MDEKEQALEQARERMKTAFPEPLAPQEEVFVASQVPLNDAVNHPSHYTYAKFEVYEVIKAFGLGFNLGNVVKYILRHPHKGGLEDLKKARWYLEREIEEWEEEK